MVETSLKIISWVKANRVEALFLAIILLTGALFRLYRIDEYMTFLGDEGRDVIVVRRLLVNFDPILVGPGTSIGNMYLGPLYYYLMAPFLLLANFSPVGPAVMIAILGILTIFFVWNVARQWFGKLAGLLSASLYAISPVVINYSKSSWNPNIMPFFALLCIYSIWRVWKFNEMKWLIVLGVSYAFVLQSHYLGLLLVPVLGLFWLLTLFKIKNSKLIGNWKSVQFAKQIVGIGNFAKYSILGFGIFAILMSPLVIFDSRHEWRNFSAIKVFFTERQTTVSARPWSSLPKLPGLVEKVSTSLISANNKTAGRWASYVIYLIIAAAFVSLFSNSRTKLLTHIKNNLKEEHNHPYLILFVWLGVALVGLGVYKQEIYDHYYGFFFAAPFLLIGGLSQTIVNKNKFLGGILVMLVTVYLLVVNLANNPLKYPPNRQLQRSVEVSEKIIDESKSQEFNIAVVAERNYEGAYQYFLENWNAPVVMIDPQKADETITDQLFVICELPREKCDPTHNPKAEIANFGWTKIDGEWQVAGVTLYKLTHSQ